MVIMYCNVCGKELEEQQNLDLMTGKLNWIKHSAGSAFSIKACSNCYPNLLQAEYKLLKKACKYPDPTIQPIKAENKEVG